MTLHIATDPEAVTTSRAIARASVWLSSVLIGMTAVIDMAFIPVTGRVDILFAVAALVIMGLAIGGSLAARSALLALGWTCVAGIALFGYASIVADVTVTASAPTASTDTILLSMPGLAMLVCGIALRSLRSALAVGVVAFVLAQGLILLAGWIQHMPLAPDLPIITTWLGLALLVSAFWVARRETVRGTRVIEDAARDEVSAATTGQFSVAAAEWLRETVLDDLRAIAASRPGELDGFRAAAVRKHLADLDDIAPILEESTLAAVVPPAATPPMLAEVIERGRQWGLSIALAGQVEAVGLLPPATSRRLQSAILSCLDNVKRHSGVTDAEIAVMDGESQVSVLVSDAGAGFDPDAVSIDHADGLRVQVIEPLAEIGGSVQIWARPGAGTAVFLTVGVR